MRRLAAPLSTAAVFAAAPGAVAAQDGSLGATSTGGHGMSCAIVDPPGVHVRIAGSATSAFGRVRLDAAVTRPADPIRIHQTSPTLGVALA